MCLLWFMPLRGCKARSELTVDSFVTDLPAFHVNKDDQKHDNITT